jgi:sarcosine oxidase subunit beta
MARSIVIIGGGVIGASIAWHLVSRGARNVVVMDRAAAPGGGSTSRATGGFRGQFASAVNVRLSMLSREKLVRFTEEVGGDPEFRPVGYLFLARDRGQIEQLRTACGIQQSAGFGDARLIDRSEALSIAPYLHPDGFEGAAFCPSDGTIRPMRILEGYREAAERLGARFSYGSEVREIEVRDRRAVSVNGVPADAVINAAGPWAREIGALAGVDVPVEPLTRRVAVTEPTDVLPEEMPLVIYLEDGFHLRSRDGRVLLLWPEEHERWEEEVRRKADRRVPVLRNVRIDSDRGWSGFYEMSPDRHAILGRSMEVENFFLANGSSGHGVMHAPAIGQLLAEMVFDGVASSIDVEELRPSRFAEGRPVECVELL